MMSKIGAFFFPEASYGPIVCLCYVFIFLTAYKRFNSLTMNFGTYDAPETARPWTTWLRYHAAAAIYACLYGALFGGLYNLFNQHPLLIDAAMELVGQNNQAGILLGRLNQDMKLVNPILVLILLTWGAEKYRRTTSIDRKLRYYFQHLGSIPGAISLTIRRLKRYELEVCSDACIASLTEEMRDEIMLPMLQDDPKSLEHLYLRACHLFNQIELWNSISSDFFQFQVAYHQAFENIKTRFKKLNRNTRRYYQLKLKFAKDAHLYAQMAEGSTRFRLDDMYPKVLTELRKDLKDELKHILENIYIFIACAVHSRGLIAKKRKKLLQSFGFKITCHNNSNGDDLDPNDLAILAIFLVFVVPVSAVFASLAGDERPGTIQSVTYAIWSAMALFVGLSSVTAPIMIKRIRETSDHRFWRWIRPKKGHAWFSYILSGFMAGVAGIFGMFLLNYLNVQNPSRPGMEILTRFVPWGMVPLAVALTLSYHLDRNHANGKATIMIEALTTALSAILAAVLALVINAGIVHGDELIPKMYFSLSAAALLGGTIGAVIPDRWRVQAKNLAKAVHEKVHLKEIIQGCLNHFDERADKQNVKINAALADNLPLVTVDPDQIRHAINGLISNALEFTPREGVISIAAGPLHEGGIKFTVKDNGIGMSNHKVHSIIDAPPELVISAWERVGEGVDADLIQIRSIAEKHGGKFSLHSHRWQGTEVTIELPGERVETEPCVPPPRPPDLNSIATLAV